MPFPPMNFDGMNEADIRAEVIEPLLRLLGYQSGTAFNVARERTLRYPRISLGRKKPTDPEVRGRPDYILEIRGLDRWIIEAKPPNVDISADDIEQAFSYAFLPEVAAGFFVLCNGRRILVFKTVDGPSAPPLIELTYEQFEQKIQIITNILSPDSFRRAILAQHVDTARPLAPGLPSSISIVSGEIEYERSVCQIPQIAAKLQKLVGVRMPVQEGRVWRVENRLAVWARQGFLHRHHQDAARAAGAGEATYFSSDLDISSDPSRPNIFESTNAYDVKRGQPQFDMLTQQQGIAEVDCRMTTYTEAVGTLDGSNFAGQFYGAGEITYQPQGKPHISFELLGTFWLKLQS
jgi:hypothetical protein